LRYSVCHNALHIRFSLHDALPISIYKKEEHASQAFMYAGHDAGACCRYQGAIVQWLLGYPDRAEALVRDAQQLVEELSAIGIARSEEHTSELQSLAYLVCRPPLEK